MNQGTLGFPPRIRTAQAPGRTHKQSGVVRILPLDSEVAINKTVPGATSVVLPLGTSKVGPIRILDALGDANVNTITLTVDSGKLIAAGGTAAASKTITTAFGSITLVPRPDGSYLQES